MAPKRTCEYSVKEREHNLNIAILVYIYTMAFIELKFFADRSDIRKLLSHQKFIIEQLLEIKNTMATKAEFQQALADVSSALDNIGDDITRLTDQLAAGNLSESDEQEIFTELRSLADRAHSIAGRTPEEGTPEEPENPEEPGEGPVPA